MKNKLLFELLQLLMTYNRMTSSEMALNLNVSNKTVRNYLHKSHSLLEQFNIELISIPGQGYSLRGTKDNLLHLQNYILEHVHECSNLMKDDRIIYLCFHLLKNDTPLYIHTLESKLFVSRSSIYSDIHKVNEILKKFKLHVKTTRKNGFYLIGNEIDKRNALYELIQNYHNQNFHSFDSKIDEYFNSYYQINNQSKCIHQLIQKIENSKNMKIAYSDIDYIVIMIQICLNRIRYGQLITLDEQRRNYLKGICDQQYLDNIIEHFIHYFSIHLKEDEALYITSLFLFLKNTSTETINSPHFRVQATNIVNEFVPLVYRLFPILDQPNFEEGLIHHLANYLEKSTVAADYQNPYTAQIKKEFNMPYQIAQTIINIAEKYTDISFPDDEIAFIAIHIASAIEKSLKPLRVIFLYEHRFSELKFSSSLIEAHIKEIDIIEKMKYQEFLHSNKLPVFDMIFTTFPLSDCINVPVYRIPFIPNKQFVRELREIIRNYFINHNPATFHHNDTDIS